MTTARDALCCLFDAVSQSAADAGAEPFRHIYPSAALTYPYCSHHALVGRSLPPTVIPPPDGITPMSNDPQTVGRVYYHRFELHVVRCGPPMPDESTQCLGTLYGDCDSPAGHGTLAGHELAVTEETERLTAELLDRWCECLRATIPYYGAHAPRWIEPTSALITTGRFTALQLTVGTRLG